MIPLNMFGSGMIRAATILSTCILGNDRIILIDELENGLHFSAVPPLIGLCLSYLKKAEYKSLQPLTAWEYWRVFMKC